LNLYYKKRRWKWVLLFVALIIFASTLFYSNILVNKISDEEQSKIKIWADAVEQKAKLVNYTNEFFEKVRKEEQRRVNLIAKAYNKLIEANLDEELSFYLELISNNKTIPCIITDEKGLITFSVNIDFGLDTIKYLQGELKEEFSIYKAIVINYTKNKKQYLYYKESSIYTDLRTVIDDLVKSFINETVVNSASVPVIVTDSSCENIINYGNIDTNLAYDYNYMLNLVEEMKKHNKPIELNIVGYGKSYVFYKESLIVKQIRFFPYIQFLAIALFIIISYILFNIARKSEQNQVWVGMSKETAHQLGTPISSLIGWVELLKLQNIENNIIDELKKDIERLETVSQRFSKIGSKQELKTENLNQVISNFIDYLKNRTSNKIEYILTFDKSDIIYIKLNRYLFEWVIENICKNAIDAIEGKGSITIDIDVDKNYTHIDISDTGKGMDKRVIKTVFKPGFTTKKRGWGLGLSLSERIIKEYHKGRIFVKNSVLGKGTTFRISLKNS